jgi:DNA-binding NtrC family response regulator
MLILLVDDDDSVRSSTSRLLARAGYSVLEARSMREAREHWLAGQQEIGLLLTDQALGDGDGVELLNGLRGDRAGLPVVLYSGHDPGSLRHGAGLPADVHLLGKPFSRDDLLGVVRSALTGSLPSPD